MDELEAPADPPRPGPPPLGRGGRRALGLVTMSHAVQHFYAAGVALTYPWVIAQFHVSLTVLGIVVGISGLVGGLFQGLAGLIRRASARRLLGGQNLGLAATSLLGAAAPGFALFGAARVLAAFVLWPQHPIGSAYLSERFPQRRATVLSWHTTGGSIGTVAIPIVVGVIIQFWSWRWALVALALPMALGGLWVGLRLPQERGGHPAPDAPPEARTAGNDPPARVPLRRVLRRPQVVAVLLASTIAAGGRGLGTLGTYVPVYLKQSAHLSPIGVTIAYTALVAASVVGPVLAGHLSDRLGRRRVLIATYVVAAAALAGYPLAGSGLLVVAAAGLVVGFFAYAESPLLQAVFSDVARDANSRAAFGAYFAIGYGVGSIWLPILGWVIERHGFTAAFVVMAASFLIAAAVVSAIREAPRTASAGTGAGPA